MLAQLPDLTNKLLDIKYNRIPKGLGVDIPEIDEFIRFKRSSFDVVVGHANTGKTTVILYLQVAYAMKHGLKWLVFSSENTAYSIARKVVEFYTGKAVEVMTDSEIEKAMTWVDSHFKIIDVKDIYTARTLLDEALEIKKDFNYDGLLIDPYNSLAKDKTLLRSVGGHEYDYQIASEMRLFCDRNDVSIWLNCHAVTEALRRTHPRDHEKEGLPVPPTMADVEGGGKWGNRANQVYTIHRYTQHPTEWMISEIHVRKVKETETGGRPTSIDAPVCIRMNRGSAGFSFAGTDILHPKYTNINELLNY